MAHYRSQQPTPIRDGHGHSARPAIVLRVGRTAREGLARPANDNRARIWNRAGGAVLLAAALTVIAYAVLRWFL
jgi:hypothetical protein